MMTDGERATGGRWQADRQLTSGQARTPMSGAGLYAGFKGAMEAITRAFAADLGPHGITVNAVAPGATATEKFMVGVPEEKRSRRSRTPRSAGSGRRRTSPVWPHEPPLSCPCLGRAGRRPARASASPKRAAFAAGADAQGALLGVLDALTRTALVRTSPTKPSSDFAALLGLAGPPIRPTARPEQDARGACAG